MRRATGELALQWLAGASCDLIVLDVMLPGIDGFGVCRSLREQGNNTPVLFLTARGDPADRVRGLESGGDDYLAKPFHLQEFLLRVRAILRRWDWYRSASATAATAVLRFGGNEVDFRAFRARAWNGEAHELTEKEAMILKVLAEHAGEIVSREDLLEKVWGYDVFPSTRTVDNFILRLRKRFEARPRQSAPLPHRVGSRLPLPERRCAMSAPAAAHRHARLGARPVAGAPRGGAAASRTGAPAVQLVHIKTAGDLQTEVPLWQAGGRAFFTKEIDKALLEGAVDIAVHSLKDLSTQLDAGITLAATLPRADARDALLSREGVTLAGLPKGARVGTSSLRRRAFLMRVRPDLTHAELRGNVPTRVERLHRGDYDAIILAAAGLARLNLSQHVTELLPSDEFPPAVSQGIIGVCARAGDAATLRWLLPLDDREARLAATAERALLRRLEGGCQVPLGALATVTDRMLQSAGVRVCPRWQPPPECAGRGTGVRRRCARARGAPCG